MNYTTALFEEIILYICTSDTSSRPDEWSRENPTQGHCAVVAVLVQEIFGGTIMRVSLAGTPYENFGSHYFNVIEGEEVDFTRDQFAENPYVGAERASRTREKILLNPDTKRRYELLSARFVEAYAARECGKM